MVTILEELSREYEYLDNMAGYVAVTRDTPITQHPAPIHTHCEPQDIGPMKGDPVLASVIQAELAARTDLSPAEKARRWADDMPLDAQLYH